MQSEDIRSSFIKYFEGHDHQQVTSSSLVPENDPTLLFNNAGMNQFKNTFLGLEKRSYTTAVSSQKCVRAGGKHNDLENVGQTARHHTFFEMLGNFSFGEYFKKDAIHFAWDFLTNQLGIDKKLLYISTFDSDDEAADIWHKQEKVPKDRIFRFGEKDNFWRMGDVGPCGPCSEIFIDLGPNVPGDPKQNVMGGEGDRFMEIWNLVFMQFNEAKDGSQTPLPKPSVDTGMGLERLSTVMQGEINNYHSDLFMELINKATQISGVEYYKDLSSMDPKDKKQFEKSNMALRVLADHARAASFLIADGVLPTNEGRGYVLRRILRRGIRYGRQVSENSLLPKIVRSVIAKMGPYYSELKSQDALIETTVADEEQRFLQTLDQGTLILNESIEKMLAKGQRVLEGKTAFKLYDTYGFPMDLTQVVARERGLDVDEIGFKSEMDLARKKAQSSWKGKTISGNAAHMVSLSQFLKDDIGVTEFLGYESTEIVDSRVIALSDGENSVDTLKQGQNGILALDRTCFYAEGGGQVGDSGYLKTPKTLVKIHNCKKQNDIYLHHIEVETGTITLGDTAETSVETSLRRKTECNHSATHLLHSALRQVLGTHVQQAGSLVDPNRLRFDFTHNNPLSNEEIENLESLVNSEISLARSVSAQTTSHEQALKDGALALFGEKYGDNVRVVKMGDFSMELCGGTHVVNTSIIRAFKIVSESGVSSGVRRIEALTHDDAIQYLMKNTLENQKAREATGLNENWSQYLSHQQYHLADSVESLKKQIRDLQKDLKKAQTDQISIDPLIEDSLSFSTNGKNGRLVLGDIPLEDRQALSDLADKLKDKIQSGVVVLVGLGEKSHPLIVTVSKDLTREIPAGKLLKEVAESMGGKGGGRPDFAQGAAPNRKELANAFSKATKFVMK